MARQAMTAVTFTDRFDIGGSEKMNDSFWTGGPEALARALREEFEEKMRMAQSDASVEELKSEYKRRLEEIGSSLF